MEITLIGGHGKVALLAMPLLTQAGHSVRAVVRNPDHVRDVEATGASAVVTDIETLDGPGWEDLLRGADAVVWSAGAGGGDPRRTYAVDRDAAIASIDAAASVGARRYLMVSYIGAGPDHGVPEDDPFFAYAESKSAADEHLRGSDLDWTVLGPSGLTLEPASGLIEVDPAEPGEVSRANVAHVIAACLEDSSTAGRTIAFNDGEQEIDKALSASAS